jgi:Glycosyl transferase family 2
MTTVVIPAHNEGRVLGRLLSQIVPEGVTGELKVLVIANGCTDDTVDVAASFGPCVQVISLPVASKYQALAAADGAARDFPRIYVDADVEFDAGAVRALAAALRRPGVLAAAPERMLNLAGRSWPVRWFYDVWSRLPEARSALWGRGAIAVGEPGQLRLSGLPELMGDDLAASLVFAAHERVVVPGARVIVHTPRTFADLLRLRVRSVTANAQIGQAERAPRSAERTQLTDLASLVRTEPALAPRVAYFLLVACLARVAARRAVARGDFTTWLRDESSRTGSG